MPTVVCKSCGVDFSTPQWRLNQGKGKFCSRRCADDALRSLHSHYPAEYMAYHDARRRCTNPYHETNKTCYKERNIKFLFNSFKEFIEHIGPRPVNTSLDRINNDGNYEPGNVRWATVKQQAQNRRTTNFLALKNELMSASDWDSKLGLARGTVSRRINVYGWSVEKALTIKGKNNKLNCNIQESHGRQ